MQEYGFIHLSDPSLLNYKIFIEEQNIPFWQRDDWNQINSIRKIFNERDGMGHLTYAEFL